jgi:2-hydroxy-6-oxonona-2,4-dienedioate hydrolase
MRRRIMLGVAAVLSGVVILVGVAYLRDMQRAYARVSGRTKVIPSPYGDIEYAEGGRGPDVLVIHGSGGGFDQGELLVQAFLGDNFHWIAPSRFGYLRSTYQDGATFVDQAHAYAALLDHLGVEKVAVVTISHGGPSALLFALLYPERVSSLTLLSTGVTAIDAGAQEQASKQGSMLAAIFKYDWLYWGVTKLFKRQFMALMGATDAVIAELTPPQRQLVDRVIDEMNPVSLRSAGAAFDNRAAMPREEIEGIRAPTLIIHATDDTLQLFQNAEYAAATIPGARLMRFERGGHLVMAAEEQAIRIAVQRQILDHVK